MGAGLLVPGPQSLLRLFTQTSVQAGDTIADTAAKSGFATKYTLPADLLKVGDELILRWTGLVSGTAVTGPGLTFEAQEDGAAIVSSGNPGSMVAGGSNVAWEAEMRVVVAEIGATGDLLGTLTVRYPSSATALRLLTVPVTLTSFPTNAANVLGLAVTFSAANPSNTITQRTFTVDLVRAA